MHILDAIKALKGGLADEKEEHMQTMTERDAARHDLAAMQGRAEKAEAELAAIAAEVGVTYPETEDTAKEA